MNQYKLQEAHCSLFSEKRSFVVGDAAENHRCMLDCKVIDQKGETVVIGTAEIIAPTENISRLRVELPEVDLHEKP